MVLISTWPLGFNDGVTDAENGVTNGTVGTDVMYGEGPPGVGNSSRQFNGGAESYVDLRVYNRSAIWTTNNDPDFSLSMYLYVNDVSSGTLLHYVSDEYSDEKANDTSDINQFKVFIENGELFVDFGADRITSLAGTVLAGNEWFHFVFSRDASQSKIFVYLNRNATKFIGEMPGLNDKVTRFPGYIRVGNSFNTIAAASGPLIGRAMCLKMFAMKVPLALCEFDKDCGTASIVTTTTTTTTTTTMPLTTSTTPMPSAPMITTTPSTITSIQSGQISMCFYR